jgi:hypothetical protein
MNAPQLSLISGLAAQLRERLRDLALRAVDPSQVTRSSHFVTSGLNTKFVIGSGVVWTNLANAWL